MLDFFNLIISDIKISLRKKNESIISILFFIFSILILPIIFQGDQIIIKKFLIGIIWFLTLLTIIFSVEKLFEQDYEDGILDQIYLSGIPLETIFLAKSLTIWIITCLPIIILSPLLVLLFNLQADKLINIFIALLIGTPILCMIGTVTSALVLGFNKGSSIISLITLPLYIPVLIFGIEASNSEIILNEISQEFKILIGYLLIVIAVSPWIGGLALRLKYR
ncbi:MAG: Heme exporter protein B [Alphaproteobacteria bacterium MarineAlpha6_Bin6]|jgi:heme exporter protein B|nr:heme exporter protein CcmB [Pelagibacteraceae bacterium]PPR30412.1 MAG: Heme exporter protein B [Alphaproteobacteria bacterium MarineAlpha6_Bin6]PPR33904.1 MAG: Heme exporter protein B [Alphaproteobacteria bacterium MarineAlpha6_Bin5]|tara:strand:- start:96 stop:761 length:666 start_codon:yes stop_codon:yes gene_type:complete